MYDIWKLCGVVSSLFVNKADAVTSIALKQREIVVPLLIKQLNYPDCRFPVKPNMG